LATQRIVLAFTVLAAVLCTAPAAIGAGPATRLWCGATVRTDTVLPADLTGCTGPALVIGANGVTLDLNGHAVRGGIEATGRSNLQVRDGVVEGDVRFEHVRNVTVRRLRVRGGSIACLDSAGCTIAGSHVTGGGISIVQSESGVPNRVRGNVVRAAPGAGIRADRTDTTSIIGNLVHDSAIGIETAHAADLRIARNLLLRNFGDGLSGSFGSTAAIVRNVLVSNGGDGISLRVWGGETLIAQNDASQNGGNGILGTAVAHWTVVRNHAARNGEAGLAITGAVVDTTLARNIARRNRALGIDAAPGVTDGGGNVARANGVAGQCAGIAC
jgi:hypothetical protein